jgi:hypothetical protein
LPMESKSGTSTFTIVGKCNHLESVYLTYIEYVGIRSSIEGLGDNDPSAPDILSTNLLNMRAHDN